ncbi:MAG: hypothetical protein Q9201_007204 [Fulgogasparrea decipioides]
MIEFLYTGTYTPMKKHNGFESSSFHSPKNVLKTHTSLTPENDRTLRDDAVERVMNLSNILGLQETRKRQLMEHIHNVKDFRGDLFLAFLKAQRLLFEDGAKRLAIMLRTWAADA